MNPIDRSNLHDPSQANFVYIPFSNHPEYAVKILAYENYKIVKKKTIEGKDSYDDSADFFELESTKASPPQFLNTSFKNQLSLDKSLNAFFTLYSSEILKTTKKELKPLPLFVRNDFIAAQRPKRLLESLKSITSTPLTGAAKTVKANSLENSEESDSQQIRLFDIKGINLTEILAKGNEFILAEQPAAPLLVDSPQLKEDHKEIDSKGPPAVSTLTFSDDLSLKASLPSETTSTTTVAAALPVDRTQLEEDHEEINSEESLPTVITSTLSVDLSVNEGFFDADAELAAATLLVGNSQVEEAYNGSASENHSVSSTLVNTVPLNENESLHRLEQGAAAAPLPTDSPQPEEAHEEIVSESFPTVITSTLSVDLSVNEGFFDADAELAAATLLASSSQVEEAYNGSASENHSVSSTLVNTVPLNENESLHRLEQGAAAAPLPTDSPQREEDHEEIDMTFNEANKQLSQEISIEQEISDVNRSMKSRKSERQDNQSDLTQHYFFSPKKTSSTLTYVAIIDSAYLIGLGIAGLLNAQHIALIVIGLIACSAMTAATNYIISNMNQSF